MNSVVFLEWRNERRWARWEVSSGEPWTDSKQWPSEGGSSGGEGVSPGGEDGSSGREDGLFPQLYNEDVRPKSLATLRVCEAAILGVWGFMEPSQCSRTTDEKMQLKWEKVPIELGDVGLGMVCGSVSDFQQHCILGSSLWKKCA